MAPISLDEETSKKVIRQVEFYFGDSNLPKDKFLRDTISKTEDGLVSLALICSFSRMRGHLGLGNVKADDISDDTVNSVAETLKTSSFLKLSDDGKKVGRKTELGKPEEVIEQLDNRTIAASPLPYDVKLEDVESYFAQFAKVNSVRLPRHVAHKNLFCGTALVEFSEEEDADKVLKESLRYAGAELELKPKKVFDAEREKQQEEFGKSHGYIDHKNAEQTSYQKGLIVAFTLKKKSSGDDSKQNGDQEPETKVEASETNEGECVPNVSEEDNNGKETDKASENGTNGAAKDDESKEKAAEAPENDENEVKAEEKNGGKTSEGKSVIETYKNNQDVVTREDLRPVFQRFGTVKYIDFHIGAESGYIRYEEPEAAQKARAAAVLTEEGGLLVKNYIATLEPVTGEAEKEYWSKNVPGGQARFHDKGHGHRGRGGKYNKNGRGRSRDKDSHSGRPNKVQKVAS